MRKYVCVLIYLAFCLDVAQGHMKGAPNECVCVCVCVCGNWSEDHIDGIDRAPLCWLSREHMPVMTLRAVI